MAHNSEQQYSILNAELLVWGFIKTEYKTKNKIFPTSLNELILKFIKSRVSRPKDSMHEA